MLGTQTISFDLDDTLNWMSRELATAAGMSYIPKFDDIKAGLAPDEFYKTRNRLFADPNFWAEQPRTAHADAMIDMTEDANFKPIICTKTPTSIKGMNHIAAAKIKWQQDNYPELDMLIATGQKHADSTGLVDDSYNNCQIFNKYSNWYRPVLVWDNSRPNLDALPCFLNMCRHFNIEHKYQRDALHQSLTVVKAKDTGRIAIANRDTYDLGLPCGETTQCPDDIILQAVNGLDAETGIYIPFGLDRTFVFKLHDMVVHCHYAEVESELHHYRADWMHPQQFIACTSGEYRDFNTVLLYNMGMI